MRLNCQQPCSLSCGGKNKTTSQRGKMLREGVLTALTPNNLVLALPIVWSKKFSLRLSLSSPRSSLYLSEFNGLSLFCNQGNAKLKQMLNLVI